MDTVEPLFRDIQIGADIGQRVDNTAIVVAERQLRDYQGWSAEERPVGGDIHYTIRFVERLPLGTPYPAVADRLASIYNQLEPMRNAVPTVEDRILASHGKVRQRSYTPRVRAVLVDATGVGQPIVDLIRAAGVRCTPVYLTSGAKATAERGELHLAKGLMVSRLQVLLQQHCIHLPQTEEAEALTQELLNYEIKVTDAQNLQMGVFKTGKHDDLATALGLACWEAQGGTITHGYGPDVNGWRG